MLGSWPLEKKKNHVKALKAAGLTVNRQSYDSSSCSLNLSQALGIEYYSSQNTVRTVEETEDINTHQTKLLESNIGYRLTAKQNQIVCDIKKRK
ncbi:unnamed protein product, partial [Thlaspi arvense]